MAKSIVARRSKEPVEPWTVDSTRAWLATLAASTVADAERGWQSTGESARWKVYVEGGLLVVICSGAITRPIAARIDAEVGKVVDHQEPLAGIVDMRTAVMLGPATDLPALWCSSPYLAYVNPNRDSSNKTAFVDAMGRGLLRLEFTNAPAAVSWASRHSKPSEAELSQLSGTEDQGLRPRHRPVSRAPLRGSHNAIGGVCTWRKACLSRPAPLFVVRMA